MADLIARSDAEAAIKRSPGKFADTSMDSSDCEFLDDETILRAASSVVTQCVDAAAVSNGENLPKPENLPRRLPSTSSSASSSDSMLVLAETPSLVSKCTLGHVLLIKSWPKNDPFLEWFFIIMIFRCFFYVQKIPVINL
jgi:hypothetical protein